MTLPNLMVLDMELAAPVRLGRHFLPDSKRVGPGCICTAPVGEGKLRFLYADKCSGEEVAEWVDHFPKHAGLVTWNGLGFDVPVIGAHIHPATWLPGGPHVDLYALCALLDAGVPVSELIRLGVDEGWQKTWPYDVFPRNRGWRLDDVGQATLGIAKMEGMSGKDAPIAWQRGELDKVRRYCAHDVALTRRLWLHAWEGEELVSGAGRRVTIPRELLQ